MDKGFYESEKFADLSDRSNRNIPMSSQFKKRVFFFYFCLSSSYCFFLSFELLQKNLRQPIWEMWCAIQPEISSLLSGQAV